MNRIVCTALATALGCAHAYTGEEESVGPADPSSAAATAAPRKRQGDEPKKYADPPVVQTRYDEFKDTTTTETVIPLVPRYSTSHRPQSVTLMSASRGRKPLPDAIVVIEITDRSSDWRHTRDPELILLADDRRLTFSKMLHRGTVGRDQNGLVVEEHVFSRISIDDLMALATARSVRGRLDISRFDIPSDQLHRFAGFARAIGVEPVNAETEPATAEGEK